MSAPVEAILGLFGTDAASAMYDEVVTERDHALQAAQRAGEAGAPEATVAAALLHDIGRLLIEVDDGHRAADRAHDRVGERYLQQWFGPAVTVPVGLHVEAKRFLCATDPAYVAVLSPVSVRSLEVQGGPMSEAEVAAFCSRPEWEAAVRLRRWDDEAKVEGHPTKAVDDYAPLLERLIVG